MDTWLLIVSVSAGVITVGTLLVKVSKVIEVLNKKCPCTDVCELQAKVDKHDEGLSVVIEAVKSIKPLEEKVSTYAVYFSNDHEAIEKLGDITLAHNYEFKNFNDKVDRIDENVKRLLAAWDNR